METIFVTVSCKLSTILNKIDFLIMEALISIYKNFPNVVGMTTKMDFISDPTPCDDKSTIKPYTIENGQMANGLSVQFWDALAHLKRQRLKLHAEIGTKC